VSVLGAAATRNLLAAVVLTVIGLVVPVTLEVTVSVALTVRLPAVATSRRW
jgi:hypothetical protein